MERSSDDDAEDQAASGFWSGDEECETLDTTVNERERKLARRARHFALDDTRPLFFSSASSTSESDSCPTPRKLRASFADKERPPDSEKVSSSGRSAKKHVDSGSSLHDSKRPRARDTTPDTVGGIQTSSSHGDSTRHSATRPQTSRTKVLLDSETSHSEDSHRRKGSTELPFRTHPGLVAGMHPRYLVRAAALHDFEEGYDEVFDSLSELVAPEGLSVNARRLLREPPSFHLSLPAAAVCSLLLWIELEPKSLEGVFEMLETFLTVPLTNTKQWFDAEIARKSSSITLSKVLHLINGMSFLNLGSWAAWRGPLAELCRLRVLLKGILKKRQEVQCDNNGTNAVKVETKHIGVGRGFSVSSASTENLMFMRAATYLGKFIHYFLVDFSVECGGGGGSSSTGGAVQHMPALLSVGDLVFFEDHHGRTPTEEESPLPDPPHVRRNTVGNGFTVVMSCIGLVLEVTPQTVKVAFCCDIEDSKDQLAGEWFSWSKHRLDMFLGELTASIPVESHGLLHLLGLNLQYFIRCVAMERFMSECLRILKDPDILMNPSIIHTKTSMTHAFLSHTISPSLARLVTGWPYGAVIARDRFRNSCTVVRHLNEYIHKTSLYYFNTFSNLNSPNVQVALNPRQLEELPQVKLRDRSVVEQESKILSRNFDAFTVSVCGPIYDPARKSNRFWKECLAHISNPDINRDVVPLPFVITSKKDRDTREQILSLCGYAAIILVTSIMHDHNVFISDTPTESGASTSSSNPSYPTPMDYVLGFCCIQLFGLSITSDTLGDIADSSSMGQRKRPKTAHNLTTMMQTPHTIVQLIDDYEPSNFKTVPKKKYGLFSIPKCILVDDDVNYGVFGMFLASLGGREIFSLQFRAHVVHQAVQALGSLCSAISSSSDDGIVSPSTQYASINIGLVPVSKMILRENASTRLHVCYDNVVSLSTTIGWLLFLIRKFGIGPYPRDGQPSDEQLQRNGGHDFPKLRRRLVKLGFDLTPRLADLQSKFASQSREESRNDVFSLITNEFPVAQLCTDITNITTQGHPGTVSCGYFQVPDCYIKLFAMYGRAFVSCGSRTSVATFPDQCWDITTWIHMEAWEARSELPCVSTMCGLPNVEYVYLFSLPGIAARGESLVPRLEICALCVGTLENVSWETYVPVELPTEEWFYSKLGDLYAPRTIPVAGSFYCHAFWRVEFVEEFMSIAEQTANVPMSDFAVVRIKTEWTHWLSDHSLCLRVLALCASGEIFHTNNNINSEDGYPLTFTRDSMGGSMPNIQVFKHGEDLKLIVFEFCYSRGGGADFQFPAISVLTVLPVVMPVEVFDPLVPISVSAFNSVREDSSCCETYRNHPCTSTSPPEETFNESPVLVSVESVVAVSLSLVSHRCGTQVNETALTRYPTIWQRRNVSTAPLELLLLPTVPINNS